MTPTKSEHEAIDLNAALAKVGGELALLAELFELFQNEYPNLLSALRRALTERDSRSARAAAHSLKGSLAIFSAKQATALAARLEGCAESGDLDSAVDVLAELEAEVERVAGELQRLTGANSAPNGGSQSAKGGKENP